MCSLMTSTIGTHLIHLTCSGRSQKDGLQTEQSSGAPVSVQLSSAVSANKLNDQDCLFLGGVQLHLCCCNPEEQLQLVRIAREGCALRHTDLSPGLTHIVVRLTLFCDIGVSDDPCPRSDRHINASHMCQSPHEASRAKVWLLTCTCPPVSTCKTTPGI